MADEQITETADVEQQESPATGDDAQEQTPDLGDAGKRALDEERKARRAEAKRAKDLEARLKEFEDAGKSEAQRLLDRAETAEREVATLRVENTRSRIAAKYNLGDLADVLSGDEDTMEATAKRLQSRLTAAPAREEAPVRFDGGPRTPAKRPADMNDLIFGLKRR